MDLITIASQAEFNAVVHHEKSQDCAGDCAGDCEWCRKFNKARSAAQDIAMETGTILTIAVLDKPILGQHYQAWCDTCFDGVNDDLWECSDWVSTHAKTRHNFK